MLVISLTLNTPQHTLHRVLCKGSDKQDGKTQKLGNDLHLHFGLNDDTAVVFLVEKKDYCKNAVDG
jgi:hypothetical protein